MKLFSWLLPISFMFAISCQVQVIPDATFVPEGEFRSVTVCLDKPETRASLSASGENVIVDATVFVWQRNQATGIEVLYGKSYGVMDSFSFDLLFSDAIDYYYRFEAYVNMGELDAVPDVEDVLFMDESTSAFQMTGSSAAVNRDNSGSVVIDMKRYVGKITVGSVTLDWLNKRNSFTDFTLKNVYVANAGFDASGSLAGYNNISGAYLFSEKDVMLYSPVDAVIPDGGVYDTAQYMYAYGSGSTAIVLECDHGGEIMYYHVPYEPERNSHCVFEFIVHQKGADEPLGALPDEAVEVYVSSVNVFEWVENIHGSELEPVPGL